MKIKIHVFYWIMILLVSFFTGLYMHFDGQTKRWEEFNWVYKRQHDNSQENKRLKKELHHFWNTNRELKRRIG